MSGRRITLLVDDNRDHARIVARAIERLVLPRPFYASNGEDALSLADRYDCNVCVLDYKLPGINGLETLIRLHEHKPDLPIIMMTGAHNEDVAVAAFRAKVVDYVP